MDIVLKLRELRRRRGLSQKDVGRLSGVGEKTVSSFETGDRIDAMKLSQLERLLSVYCVTLAYFFSDALASELSPATSESSQGDGFRFEDLPGPVRASIAAWASRITSTPAAVVAQQHPSDAPRAHAR
ncbi:MAG: helix-turn-helix domain-containing protein [Thermoanaerobaculia bacterium]